jgi:predicted PurR-regulated permease PerM
MQLIASEAEMRQTTVRHFRIAETLWVLAGVILLLAFGDGLALLVIALALVAMTAAWWIHRTVERRVGSKGHAVAVIAPFILAIAALSAALTIATPVQAATIDSRFDICSALRSGTSLATIETTLEARGYSATNAGALTGTTIRQQCPDQAAGVMAQLSRQNG